MAGIAVFLPKEGETFHYITFESPLFADDSLKVSSRKWVTKGWGGVIFVYLQCFLITGNCFRTSAEAHEFLASRLKELDAATSR